MLLAMCFSTYSLVGFHEIVTQIFGFSVIKFLNRFCQFSFSVLVLHV